MRHIGSTIFFAPLVFVVACGDSSGGPATQAPSFDDLGSELAGYLGEFTIGGDRTDPMALPPGGSATYNGVMSVIVNEGSTITPGEDLFIRGDMMVEANFADDTLFGTVDGFSDSDSDTYTGSLDITDGVIDNAALSTNATFVAEIDGDLTNDRTTSEFGVDAFFVGDFYGPSQEYIGGVIRGDISTPDGDLLIWDNNSQGVPDGDGIFAGSQ